ncbi:MAG: lmo0937 family membrane protein [Rhodoferax sp.]|uniref:lmo0937 family membrane protein n=1 Tax=Rhodoferax sp. TaxID=50421 RepID=UPI000AF724A3|nr:lmo0937 family membrane protein [Rhodoferax sp.]MDP2680277.1 lmo0937 family membrane protein [Rhodoferax sp.]
MLETIAVILVILWLLGLVTSYTAGGLIHALLVIAIMVILIRVILWPGAQRLPGWLGDA